MSTEITAFALEKLNSSRPLKGRMAIVTGGGHGVGRVIAEHLAKAGAKVVILGRNKERLDETVAWIRKADGDADAYQLDVSNYESVVKTFTKVKEDNGVADLLVNNAGVPGPIGSLWEIEPSEWQHTFEVNLNGVFYCSQVVLPEMLARRSGRIINVVSRAGVERWPYLSAYAVSKSAVIKFTEGLSHETGGSGVKVFAVDPGILRIGLAEWTATAGDIPAESPRGRILTWLREQFAEGKDVSPDQSAELVVLIASGTADALGGRYISVYDDIQLMIKRAGEIREKDLYTLKLRT